MTSAEGYSSEPTTENCTWKVDACEGGKVKVEPRRRYVGGFYRTTRTIRQRLEDVGIKSSAVLHEFVVCFDCECALGPVEAGAIGRDERKSRRLAKHRCLSVALATNIPSFRPSCIIERDEREVVVKMLKRMEAMQQAASREMRRRLRVEFAELRKRTVECALKGDPLKMMSTYARLERDLATFADQLIVLGFNSSKYDVPVLRKNLFELMRLDQDKQAFVVKKQNSYICVTNSLFRFLDVKLFLAPGISYDSFLKSYKCKVRKSHFPYEYMTSFEKLQEPHLPPYESFESSLKQGNTLELEYAEYEKRLKGVRGRSRCWRVWI